MKHISYLEPGRKNGVTYAKFGTVIAVIAVMMTAVGVLIGHFVWN